MSIKHFVRKIVRQAGYDVTRFSIACSHIARKKLLLDRARIDVVLDVGANTGQFAKQMREEYLFEGRIISFEPMSAAFLTLAAHAAFDPKWDALNYALGNQQGQGEMNVAGNSYSSSLLQMLPAHVRAAPESRYETRQSITMRTLDSVYGELGLELERVYLKLDTQGYEAKILEGGASVLTRISMVQVEMSLVPLYEGESTFEELHAMLQGVGFELMSIEPGFADRESGRLLQIDGIYQRIE